MTPSNDLQRFVLRWHYGTVAVLVGLIWVLA